MSEILAGNSIDCIVIIIGQDGTGFFIQQCFDNIDISMFNSQI